MSIESRLQAPILRYLRGLDDCFAFKADVSVRGIPDIICCYHGRFISFEVKVLGGKESPLQVTVGWLIQRAGGSHHVVTTCAAVKVIMREMEAEA